MRLFGDDWVIDGESVRSIAGAESELDEETIQKIRETDDVSEVYLYMTTRGGIDHTMDDLERPLCLVWYHIIDEEAVFHSSVSLPPGLNPNIVDIDCTQAIRRPIIVGNKLYEVRLGVHNIHTHGRNLAIRINSIELENRYVWSLRVVGENQALCSTDDGRHMMIHHPRAYHTHDIESCIEIPVDRAELDELSMYPSPSGVGARDPLLHLFIVARHLMTAKEPVTAYYANCNYYVIAVDSELLVYSYEQIMMARYATESPICCLGYDTFVCEDGSVWLYDTWGWGRPANDALSVRKLDVQCVPGPSKACSHK
jgi:hypothetical protein